VVKTLYYLVVTEEKGKEKTFFLLTPRIGLDFLSMINLNHPSLAEPTSLWKGASRVRAPRGVEIDCYLPFPFLELPLENMLRILFYVSSDISDIMKLRLVSRQMYAVATHDVLWQELCGNQVREYWKDQTVWSWFLLYWNRHNDRSKAEQSLIEMVDGWAIKK
jgi:hypothetical protein